MRIPVAREASGKVCIERHDLMDENYYVFEG